MQTDSYGGKTMQSVSEAQIAGRVDVYDGTWHEEMRNHASWTWCGEGKLTPVQGKQVYWSGYGCDSDPARPSLLERMERAVQQALADHPGKVVVRYNAGIWLLVDQIS